MALDFQAALSQLRKEYYLEQLPIQPDVEEKGFENSEEFQEQEDLSKGAVMKCISKEGSGSPPAKDDLVYLHMSMVRDKAIVWSTRAEHGGPGHPLPYILGKSKKLIKGIELAALRMLPGERATLEIQSSYAYQHSSWTETPPFGIRPDEPVLADVEIVCVVPGRKVKEISNCDDTYKVLETVGKEWESPHAPYRVQLALEARIAGKEGTAAPYFETTEGAPVEAKLGSHELPTALDAAVSTMVRGEEAIVSCPIALASDGTAVPAPSSSTKALRVEFTVRLIDFTQIRDLSGDGQVMKEILKRGEGVFPVDCPVEDSHITVHWRARSFGHNKAWVFDSETAGAPTEFDTGMATVPDAVDMGVRLMLKGETSLVTSSWDKAFNHESDAPEGLAKGEAVEFEITLLDFTRDLIREDTGVEERLSIAAKWKEQGNELFKRDELKLAKVKYFKAAKVMDRTGAPDDETHKKIRDLQVLCYLNLALCAQKQKEAGEAIHYASKALEYDVTRDCTRRLDPGNTKAYFRRAQAHAMVGRYDEAEENLTLAQELDPSLESDVTREKAKMAVEQKAQEARQRQQFGKFFK